MANLNKVESGSTVELDGRQYRLVAWSNLSGAYKLVPVSGGEAVYRSWATTVEVLAPPPGDKAEPTGEAE